MAVGTGGPRPPAAAAVVVVKVRCPGAGPVGPRAPGEGATDVAGQGTTVGVGLTPGTAVGARDAGTTIAGTAGGLGTDTTRGLAPLWI